MKISLDNQQVNFKQIKLNEQEIQATKALFERIKATTCNKESFLLHTQIFDVFSKHLDAESKLKSDGLAWKAGQFAKDIYIKFFTTLKDVKFGELDSEKFVDTLNVFSNEEFIPNSYGNEESLSKFNIFNFNKNVLNVSEKMHISINKYLDYLLRFPKNEVKLAEEIFDNSNTIANMLELDPEKFRNILTNHATYEMLFYSPEEVNSRCEQSSQELNMSKATFAKQIMKVGKLLSLKPEFIRFNKQEIIDILELKNEEQFNELLSKNLKIILINPNNIRTNIEKYSQMWGIDKEEIKQSFVKNPSFMLLTPEIIDSSCLNLSTKFNIKKEDFINAAFKHPKIFTFKPENIENNIAEGAKILGISLEEYTKLALRNPRLFVCVPERLQLLKDQATDQLNIPEDLFVKIAYSVPNLLTFPFEVMKYNADGVRNFLKLSEDMFLAIVYSNPALFAEKTDKVKGRLSNLASFLEINEDLIRELSVSNPQILTWSKENLVKNVFSTMEYFGISKKEYAEIFERNPRLITLKVSDIDKYTEKTTELLQLENKDVWKNALRKNPKLSTITPETVLERVEENAWALDLPVNDYLQIAFKEPQIFTLQVFMLYDSITILPKSIGITDKKQFLDAIIANPTILTIRPEWLINGIQTTANLLGLETEVFAKAALKNPQAYTINSLKVQKNMEEISEILGIPFEKTVSLALSNPSIFSLRANLVRESMEDICKNFKISPQFFAKMAVRNPHVISCTYLRFCEVLKENCNEFKISPKRFFEIGIKHPAMYTMKPSRLSRATYDSILKLASS